MNKWQRKTLGELHEVTNTLGGKLDGTATTTVKFIERQRAHMLVSKVLSAVLFHELENPNRDLDEEDAAEALAELKALTIKVYPDVNGFK